ncbi:MAG: matrixin family metalloprotease [Bacteroidota bacterium]
MKYAFHIILILLLACSGVSEKGVEIMQPCDAGITVGIQPFGDMDTTCISEVKQAIEKHYGYTVEILDPVALPENAYTTIRSPRYRADTLIRYLREIKPAAYDYIIGLTNKDISITKYTGSGANRKIKEPVWKYRDFGIFGLGFCPGPSCIISTFRLSSNGADEATMRSRLRKIAVHELGHNLGLPHCPDEHCLMQDACEKMSTIDNAEEALCEKCKKKAGVTP